MVDAAAINDFNMEIMYNVDKDAAGRIIILPRADTTIISSIADQITVTSGGTGLGARGTEAPRHPVPDTRTVAATMSLQRRNPRNPLHRGSTRRTNAAAS